MQETTFELERTKVAEGFPFVVGVDEAGRGPLAGPVVAAAVMLKDSNVAIELPPPRLADETLPLGQGERKKREKMWDLVRDSKTLSEKQREKMFAFIQEHFLVGIGIISAETIDRVNILQATFLAMKAAIGELKKNINKVSFRVVIPAPARNDSGRQVGIQETTERGWIPGQARNDTGRDLSESMFLLVDGNQTIPNISIHQEAVVGGDGIAKSIAAASIIAKVTRDRMIIEADTLYPGYGFARHKGYGTAEHMDALRRLGSCPIHRKSFRPVQLAQPENVNRRFAGVLRPKRK